MQDRSQTCSGPWTVSVSVKTQVRRRRTKTKFITEEESSKMVDSFFWTLVCSCLWLVVAFCIKWFINQQIYYYYFHFASRGRTLLASRVFHFFLVQERDDVVWRMRYMGTQIEIFHCTTGEGGGVGEANGFLVLFFPWLVLIESSSVIYYKVNKNKEVTLRNKKRSFSKSWNVEDGWMERKKERQGIQLYIIVLHFLSMWNSNFPHERLKKFERKMLIGAFTFCLPLPSCSSTQFNAPLIHPPIQNSSNSSALGHDNTTK